ncbi:hypothetical protein EJB05_50488, partial [Eragrostis curvula]
MRPPWSSSSSPTCPHSAARPPPYLAVLATDRDQPRRPKLACAFPDIYCSNCRALLPEYSLPTKQIDHRSSLVRDLPVAVAAALHLDAPSACPANHRKLSDAGSLEVDHSAALLLDDGMHVMKIKLAFPAICSAKWPQSFTGGALGHHPPYTRR